MDWIHNLLFGGQGVANSVVVMSLVAVVGAALGTAKIGSVRLGIAGPLFVGIVFGHFGLKMEAATMEFARDFGLILFVYAIGIMVGPGVFQAFKKEGVLANALAASIVVLGGLIAAGAHFLFGIPLEVVVGLLAGGTTNTPALAAGTEMLKELRAAPAQVALPGQAYAVAYPFGIVGILLAMGLVRRVFRIDAQADGDAWQRKMRPEPQPVEAMNIDVHAPDVIGKSIGDLEHVRKRKIVVSRLMRRGVQRVAGMDESFAAGDTVLAVGPRNKLAEFRDNLGRESAARLQEMPSRVKARRFLVTRPQTLGSSISRAAEYGVTITRLTRAGVELVPDAAVTLQFGDQIVCVGEQDKLDVFAEAIGNDAKALQRTPIVPIFLGLLLGVALGSVPLFVPGLPASVKLGLAGGPVIVAILLSCIGHIGPVVWYMPPAVTNAIREIGITMFMSCVGLFAGKSFFTTVFHGAGLTWMACGALVTFLPIVAVGLVARAVFKINYLTICGVLAGSMTDPPALAYANDIYPSDAQATAYTAVYPLTMCLRILAPQILLAAFWIAS